MRIGTLIQDGAGIKATVIPFAESTTSNEVLVMFGDGELKSLPLDVIATDWVLREPERKTGRVVIMADMEGITGVPNDEWAVTPAEETNGVRTAEYAAACRQMTLDVQMAIAGARAGGAQEIIIADTHWYDSNLRDEDFDVPVVRGSQAALQAMEGAVAAMLIGWHAKAGTPKACLPHTYSERIKRISIDGQEVGEIGMLTRLIASCGVPVVLVTGDYAACQEVLAAFTVTTKMVDDAGVVDHWQAQTVRSNIAITALMAIHNLRYATEDTLPSHHPGQFEVEVFPQYAIASHQEAELLSSGAYQIKARDIRASYSSFQRFVDRLPGVSAAPLARSQ